MANKIKLVRNDTLPRLRVTIYDVDTKEPVDLSGCLVKMKIREPGSETLKTTLIGTLVASPGSQIGGAGGVVTFDFGPDDLDTEGSYEAEYEVTFANGRNQTVYEVDRLTIREDFPG